MEWVIAALVHAKEALSNAEVIAGLAQVKYDNAASEREDADERVKQLDEVVRILNALLLPCAETRVPL